MRSIYTQTNGEYTVLGEYISNKTKIKVRHNNKSCNYFEYDVEPRSILRGAQCPKCSGHHRLTYDEFCTKVMDIVGDEYSVISHEYLGTHSLVRMKHNNEKCNFHEWEIQPNNFINSGNRCPFCAGTIKRTHEEFIEQVYVLFSSEYTVLGEYINSQTPIKIRHNSQNCNFNEYDIIPNNLLKGQQCRICQGLMKKTNEEFCRRVKDHLVGEEYTPITEYISANKYVKMKHNICGCKYNVIPSHFYNGRRCPKCNESKGEKIISRFLDEHKIKYISQYKFKDLLSEKGNPLRFDFAIFRSEKLTELIEYDGEFHFNKYFENDGHEMIKLHDELKNRYCKNNNIKLIRIPYTKFDSIKEILNDEILTTSHN